jgi:hypothetical protein
LGWRFKNNRLLADHFAKEVRLQTHLWFQVKLLIRLTRRQT